MKDELVAWLEKRIKELAQQQVLSEQHKLIISGRRCSLLEVFSWVQSHEETRRVRYVDGGTLKPRTYDVEGIDSE